MPVRQKLGLEINLDISIILLLAIELVIGADFLKLWL